MSIGVGNLCNCSILPLAASVALLFSPLTARAEDQRVQLPKDYHTEVVELEDTDQSAFAFSLQAPNADIAQLLESAGDARVSSNQDDLNGDGRPEIITLLSGVETCGARDCEVVIISPTGDGYNIAFDAYASSIALGPKSPSGWRELITNLNVSDKGEKTGLVWEWKGGKYEIK
ncbi:MAG TPA: hypothetical protein VNS34_13525 [Rhizobiaceae bacterium]|nr:hypothetical protein [Rhizobiaceae bacterium]